MLGYRIGWETVRKMMKNDFKMKYQKIKRVNHLGNSESSLVKRNLFARKMIDLLDKGNHIFNIDESWLPVSDYSGKVWVEKGGSSSLHD